jgi:hypothetical protein
MSKARSISAIIEAQGWSDTTVMNLLFNYIENQGDNAALAEFFEQMAEDENEEDDEPDSGNGVYCEGEPEHD